MENSIAAASDSSLTEMPSAPQGAIRLPGLRMTNRSPGSVDAKRLGADAAVGAGDAAARRATARAPAGRRSPGTSGPDLVGGSRRCRG